MGSCVKCGDGSYVMPLHGEKGGPLFCPLCAGAWHAQQKAERKRRSNASSSRLAVASARARRDDARAARGHDQAHASRSSPARARRSLRTVSPRPCWP